MNDHNRPPDDPANTSDIVKSADEQPTLLDASSSLAIGLTRAELDQQIMTAKQFPRSIGQAKDMMVSMATLDEQMASECIYSLPRGGKQIRGPSIRLAEIIATAWGNCRDGARVVFVDRIAETVEAEAVFHDLETNRAAVYRTTRNIERKKKRNAIDADMIALAGAAAMSIARRNAILGGVPKIVWLKAQMAAETVIRGDIKTLAERRAKAVEYFAKLGIIAERLCLALEVRSVDEITLDDLVTMEGWRIAIRDKATSIDDIFPEVKPDAPRKDLRTKLEEAAGLDPATGERTDSDADHTAAAEGAGGAVSSKPAGSAPAAEGEGSAPPESSAAPPDAEKIVAGFDQFQAAQAAQGAVSEAQAAVSEPQAKPKASAAKERAKPAQAGPSERAQALLKAGEGIAKQGKDRLRTWLEDELKADDLALVTIPMQRHWESLIPKES